MRHEVTPGTQESDPDPDKYLSVNPLAQDGQSRSISGAISRVCQTFCKHSRPNPSLDNDGKPGFLYNGN